MHSIIKYHGNVDSSQQISPLFFCCVLLETLLVSVVDRVQYAVCTLSVHDSRMGEARRNQYELIYSQSFQ